MILHSNTSQSAAHSLLPLAKSLTPRLRGIAKFCRDRGRCSKIAGVAIPHSNTSQTATNSLFVTSCTDMPTKNAKSLTPIFRGQPNLGGLGTGAAR